MPRNLFSERFLEVFLESSGMTPDEDVRLTDEKRNVTLKEHTGKNYPLDADCVDSIKREVYGTIMQLGPRVVLIILINYFIFKTSKEGSCPVDK